MRDECIGWDWVSLERVPPFVRGALLGLIRASERICGSERGGRGEELRANSAECGGFEQSWVRASRGDERCCSFLLVGKARSGCVFRKAARSERACQGSSEIPAGGEAVENGE